MESALDPSTWQIGFAGKDVVKEVFDSLVPDREKVHSFCKDFRELRTLNEIEANGPLNLLKLAGISHNRAVKETLAAMIDDVLRQIATLGQAQLDALLDKSYSYLTVPQLAPIAIATLERLTFVDPEVWGQIVRNGLEESPYIDLPLSLKRRIWVSQDSAFDHEIELVLSRLPDVPKPPGLDAFILTMDRSRMRADNPILTDLLRMVHGVGDDLIAQAVDKMVEKAAQETSPPKRDAIANLFHDFMVRLPAQTNSNLGTLRRMAKFLDNPVPEGELDKTSLQSVRQGLSVSTSCGSVALLVASTYSRDFLADQLVMYLMSRRGPIETWGDPSIIAAASNHIKADPWVPDLTYICMCNMKSTMLLRGEELLNDAEVEVPFQLFYPLMINEMHTDITKMQEQYFLSNASLPNEALVDLIQKGRLERRVLMSYCLQLFIHENMPGLSRFRLLLDAALGSCDEFEEIREITLAFELIQKILVS